MFSDNQSSQFKMAVKMTVKKLLFHIFTYIKTLSINITVVLTTFRFWGNVSNGIISSNTQISQLKISAKMAAKTLLYHIVTHVMTI